LHLHLSISGPRTPDELFRTALAGRVPDLVAGQRTDNPAEKLVVEFFLP
jgi:hypothetical protein